MHDMNKKARRLVVTALTLVLLAAALLPTMAAAFSFTKDPNATTAPTSTATAKPTTDPAVASNPNMMLAPGASSTSTTGSTTIVADGTAVEGEPQFGRTTAKGVNVRASANAKGSVLKQIGVTGTVFEIIREAESKDGEAYYVIALGSNKEGFVRGDLVEVINEEAYKAARYSVVPRPKATKRASSSKATATAANNTFIPTATITPIISGVTASPTPTVNPDEDPDRIVYSDPSITAYYHKTNTCVANLLSYTLSTAKSMGKTKCPHCW